jgi:hypothetical protein
MHTHFNPDTKTWKLRATKPELTALENAFTGGVVSTLTQLDTPLREAAQQASEGLHTLLKALSPKD